jgi:hypothetical protein
MNQASTALVGAFHTANVRTSGFFAQNPDAYEEVSTLYEQRSTLTVLGRQIVPAEDSEKHVMRNVIDDLRAVIGSLPFEFLYKRFDRTLSQSQLARNVSSV